MKLTTPVSRVHRHTINWGWLVFVFAIILTAPLASVAQVSTATILGSVTDRGNTSRLTCPLATTRSRYKRPTSSRPALPTSL